MEEVVNFTASRRASGSRSTSDSTSSSLPSSPSTVHSFDSNQSNTTRQTDVKLSPLYQSFWDAHKRRAQEEGYKRPDGHLIPCPTLENHSSAKHYVEALYLAHGVLRRMQDFEVDNVDLPSNQFDLRSLSSEEAIIVLEEQISGTLRAELATVEFIVGEETKIMDRILNLSTKGRLRSAVEKYLTERSIDFSPAGEDRLRAVLLPLTTIAPLIPITYSPPRARFGRLQSLKEVKINLPKFVPSFGKAHNIPLEDEMHNSSSIELETTTSDTLPPIPPKL